MRYINILFALLITSLAFGQIEFEEDFESKTAGFDLSTVGYELSHADNYSGTVTASVVYSKENKFARMRTIVNGAAKMQILKSVTVQPGCIYTFSLKSRGVFKRQIRVLSNHGDVLVTSNDYKPSSDAEETTWKQNEVTFLSPLQETSVKIGLLHYWSGTIDIDDIKVTKTGTPQEQTSYYISNSTGNDNNKGTKDSPWKTLEKVNNAFLFPGDTILFHRGDTLKGHFVPNGSGALHNPILITAYGHGPLPVLTGEVGEAGGGDYQEAILVENCDNMIFEKMDVQNNRMVHRSGVDNTDAYGIYVRNSGNKVMRNFVFRKMSMQNVFASEPTLEREDFNSIQVSGLAFHSNRNTQAGKEKNIDNILIEDCYFANIQRLGINFSHNGGDSGVGNDSINRNMNIHIRNNEFYYNGGSGVLPNGTYNCLIENNIFDHPGASTDPRMPARGSSVWNYKAINTVIQYNTCISARGYFDSYGIHIDKHNTNTFVQYNYMIDCIGGFVEILADNKNAVYRFNVSVNSGFRYSSNVSNWKSGSSTIYIYSDRWVKDENNESLLALCDGVYVYNNTVTMDYEFETSFNIDAKNMFIYNNIFSSTNGAKMGYLQYAVRTNNTPLTLSNNLYHGDVNQEWINRDSNPILGSPKFAGSNHKQEAYRIQAGSDALNNGLAIRGPVVPNAGYGVFKNIPPYPNVDFYGNAINLSSGTPNIGACNEKVNTSTNDLLLGVTDWLIYPNADTAKLFLKHQKPIKGEITVHLTNLKGEIVQTKAFALNNENTFSFDLNTTVTKGIYVLSIQGENVNHQRKIILQK